MIDVLHIVCLWCFVQKSSRAEKSSVKSSTSPDGFSDMTIIEEGFDGIKVAFNFK